MVVRNTDISIIGGGIQGLFLAYYAKLKFPNQRVHLYESHIVGGGITAYSGHLHTYYGSGNKFGLADQSIQLYKALLNEYHGFPMVERSFVGICKTDNLQHILSNITIQEIAINNAEAYPYSNLSVDFATISGLNAFVTDRSLTHNLMKIIIEKGVQVHEGLQIERIDKTSEGYLLTDQLERKTKTAIVLNATGKELLNTLRENQVEVRSKKVVALHIDKLDIQDETIYYFFDDDAFLLPQPYFKRYLFSFRCNEWDVNPDSNSLKINLQDIKNATEVLNKYTVDFSKHIMGGQVSIDLYNVPSSSNPISIELDENYFAIGVTGGSGVRLAPALAYRTIERINLS